MTQAPLAASTRRAERGADPSDPRDRPLNPERLTGFVYPVKKNGVPVRGRFQLWVNLPPEPAFDKDGQPLLDRKGWQKQKLVSAWPEDQASEC